MDLDAFNVAPFRQTMVDIAALGHVIIDLFRGTFIDSAALGVLIGGVRRSREHGQRVGVACDRPGMTRILHSTGVDSIVTVAPSVGDRVKALDESARLVDSPRGDPGLRPPC